ncbi:uncharacterized protein LOC132740587 [Ruditapes philippinarum]|uniref:uncharacterized protein LOC132740587 n=1 Tax=Ruditapes philippinarum TaxID=129788 RepID=UPI00295B7881|nr:uncharacterized protein LOC132740587 [Ruditapes philippinarum]
MPVDQTKLDLYINVQEGRPTYQICECEWQDIDFKDASGSMRMELREIKAKMKQRRLYDRTIKAGVIIEVTCRYVFMSETPEKLKYLSFSKLKRNWPVLSNVG